MIEIASVGDNVKISYVPFCLQLAAILHATCTNFHYEDGKYSDFDGCVDLTTLFPSSDGQYQRKGVDAIRKFIRFIKSTLGEYKYILPEQLYNFLYDDVRWQVAREQAKLQRKKAETATKSDFTAKSSQLGKFPTTIYETSSLPYSNI